MQMLRALSKILFFLLFCSAYADSVDKSEYFDFSDSRHNSTFVLKFGGFVDFQTGNGDQSNAYNKSRLMEGQNGEFIKNEFYSRDVIFRGNSKVYLTASREMSETFSYGTVVVFNSVIDRNLDEAGHLTEQNYVFLKLPHGKFELGSMFGSASKMRVDSYSLARGTGGVSGDWWRYINFPNSGMAGMSPTFIVQPMLPNEHGFTTAMGMGNVVVISGNITSVNSHQPMLGWGSRSNKISYYTPQINGYQLGVTFSPTTGDTGTLGGNRGSDYLNKMYGYDMARYGAAASGEGDMQDYTSVGVTKDGIINEHTRFKLSFISEFGKWQKIGSFNGQSINNSNFFTRNNLNAKAFGGILHYKNYSITGSYGDWGDSLLGVYSNGNKMFAKNKSYYWNGGFSVVYEKVAFSYTYMNSSMGGNLLTPSSVSIDIKPDFLRQSES